MEPATAHSGPRRITEGNQCKVGAIRIRFEKAPESPFRSIFNGRSKRYTASFPELQPKWVSRAPQMVVQLPFKPNFIARYWKVR